MRSAPKDTRDIDIRSLSIFFSVEVCRARLRHISTTDRSNLSLYCVGMFVQNEVRRACFLRCEVDVCNESAASFVHSALFFVRKQIV